MTSPLGRGSGGSDSDSPKGKGPSESRPPSKSPPHDPTKLHKRGSPGGGDSPQNAAETTDDSPGGRFSQSGQSPENDLATVIAPDDFIDDEGYAASTSTSYMTSIASDIRRGIVENGRLYASYGIHKSWLPIDDTELDRNDLQHFKFFLLLGNQLFLSPISPHAQDILDVGTGSGIWAMDVADAYPSASVIGVDVAPVQPSLVPPNLHFEVDDIEKDWLWAASKFDLIHGRELVMAIRDWPRLVRQALEALKPGGYLELAGSVPDFQSDDGTLPRDSAYVELGEIFFEMSMRVGASGQEPRSWRRYLEEAGFVDIVERVFKIPTNPWPRDERLKRIGALELTHFREGIANVFARGYTEILGGDTTYFEVLMARARAEVMNREMHSWVPYYVVYGRKPET